MLSEKTIADISTQWEFLVVTGVLVKIAETVPSSWSITAMNAPDAEWDFAIHVNIIEDIFSDKI